VDAISVSSYASIYLSTRDIADGPGLTDYLTGWGTIALAVVTVATILVAVTAARTDRRRDDAKRREDRDEAEQRRLRERVARQLVQARLVDVARPTIRVVQAGARSRRGYVVSFSLSNYGHSPVVAITAEIWLDGVSLQGTCTAQNAKRFMLSGEHHTLDVTGESPSPEPRLAAWRVTWTDAEGLAWCVDQAEQLEPVPFASAPPRPC
jgi:hypothetical protein